MLIKFGLKDVAEFVTLASGFKSDINIRSANNAIVVDAKSIMSVVGLDLGNELIADINSDDEEEVKRFNKEMEKYISNE